MISVGPYMGLNFGFYEIIKIKINDLNLTHHYSKNKFLPILVSMTSGAIAGGLSKIFVYPLDTIKKKLQAEVLHNTFHHHHQNKYIIDKNSNSTIKSVNLRICIQKISQEEGLKGFFKGLSPTLLKSIFSTSIAFGTFELTKLLLKRKD